MQLETRKYLHDVHEAFGLLSKFISGKTFSDYVADPMLRAAVEREFEIIGEALSQLAHQDVDVASLISDYRQIIAFRNILIHAYAQVDERLVWDIIETKLPTLGIEVRRLSAE
jgi:uncharacterized protein with HEPN domain